MFSSLFAGSSGNVVTTKVNLKFLAVGGTTGDRLKRDGLLRKMAPDLKSVALSGSSYDNRKGGFFIKNNIKNVIFFFYC